MEEYKLTEEYETQKTQNLPVLRGELALLVVVLINSLGVVLMLHFRKCSTRFPSAHGPTFSRDFWYYP